MNRSAIFIGVAAVVLLIVLVGYGQQESESERVARIEAMSDADKLALRSKLERFESLPTGEKERLIALNEELEKQPDGEELRNVMHRYYDWLKTINSGQRLELQKASLEERMELIKEIVADQERKRFTEWTFSFMKGIKRKELDAIHDWIVGDWLVREKERVLANEELAYEYRPWLRGQGNRTEAIPEKDHVYFLWFNMSFINEIPEIMPSDEDFEELKSRLDEDTRRKLEAEPERQRGVLEAMMRAAIFSKYHRREEDAELQKFYLTLDEKRKAELALLSPERYDEELRAEYRREKGKQFFGKRPPGPPPWARDRDGRRGDGRGPGDRGPGGRGPDGRGGPDRGGRGPDRRPGGMERDERGMRRPMPAERITPPMPMNETSDPTPETPEKDGD
ncbi:hypothetical protein [Blastopirellula marina]|uniref:DUF3106 domain-containing protein n=1 Tax=Blastopirellula marina TaxID=124 RepID=A0A2S8GPW3_9BACT|nr:hypothetical protein [Blastopirellula marina]PQO46391.1 hypothetical protein C5Y93_10445 [Blastopirellula marina]